MRKFNKIDAVDRKRHSLRNLTKMDREYLLDYVYSVEEDEVKNDTTDYSADYAVNQIISSGKLNQEEINELRFSKSITVLRQVLKRAGLPMEAIIESLEKIESPGKKLMVFNSVAENRDNIFSSSYLFSILSEANLNDLSSSFWDRKDVPKVLLEEGFVSSSEHTKYVFASQIDRLQRPIASFVKSDGFGIYDFSKDTENFKAKINNKDIWNLFNIMSFKNWIVYKANNSDNHNSSMNSIVFNKKFIDAFLTHDDAELNNRFLNHEDTYVRMALAMNSNLDEETYEDLADDEEINVQRMVALNNSTPQTVLADLALSKDLLTKKLIAINENTPQSVLKDFIENSHDEEVRQESLLNKNAPIELLRKEFEEALNEKDFSKYKLLTQSLAWEIKDMMSLVELSDSEIKFNLLHNPVLPKAMKNLCR